MSTVNLAPVWAVVTPYVVAVATGIVGVATTRLNSWLTQHKCSMAQDDLDQALAHVPDLVASSLASLAAHNSTATVADTLGTVTSLVASLVPAAVAQLKITPAQLQAIVAAKLPAK
jgi:hypothetical protein